MKNLFLLLLLPFCSYGQTTNPAPYCSAIPASGYGGQILSVSIGSLNNSSNAVSAYPKYTYYNNLPAPILYRGRTYLLSADFDSLVTGNNGGSPVYAGWIDFNDDYIIDAINEDVLIDSNAIPDNAWSDGTRIKTALVTIPINATKGITRMRIEININCITSNYGVNGIPFCDCGSTFYGSLGETQDYNIDIEDCTPPADITGINTVYIGSSTTLYESVSGGIWSSSNTNVATVNNGIVTGLSEGATTITYTIDSCGSTSTILTVLTAPSGIENVNQNNAISVYPNPSTGSFTIDNAQGEMIITDMLGRIIMNKNIVNKEVVNLPSGAYLIKIAANGSVYRNKVIIL